jgi:hypothetical protein
VAIGWVTEIRRDVHDDVVIFIVSSAAGQDQSTGRLAHPPMLLACRHEGDGAP